MNPHSLSRRMRAALALSSLLAGLTGIGSRAHAQAWLPDRAYTEGPGIRVGDLEIHPGVAVRGGYDTNVFRADGTVRTAQVDGQTVEVTRREQGSGILAVTPHLHLSTLSLLRRTEGEDREGTQRSLPPVAFRGGLSATYLHYFIDNAPKNLEVDTDLWVGILPQRPFNIDLAVAYARSVRPFTQYAGNKNAYNFHNLQPRVRFNFGSRSQVLTAFIGYAPRALLYENAAFNYLNNLAHIIETGAAWKFLPSTALIYDGTLDLTDYSKDDIRATRSPVVFADSKRFRTRLGINGAITRNLSLRVFGGYAGIVFNNRDDGRFLDDHEDVIGEAIFSWRFGPGQTSQLEWGYQRDLFASALGGWTRLDRGLLTLRALIGRVFQLSLEGGVAYVGYGRLWGYDRRNGVDVVSLGINGTSERNDVRLDGAVRGEYRVTNWLSLMADVSVQSVITDFDYAVYFGNAPVPDPADYVTIMAFGGVRAHY